MLTHSGTWWLIATCMLPMTLGQLSSAPHGVSGVQNKVQNQPQKQGETSCFSFCWPLGWGSLTLLEAIVPLYVGSSKNINRSFMAFTCRVLLALAGQEDCHVCLRAKS